MGSVVKAKVGEMEENIMEGISRRMRKGVMRCVQDVVGKKKFLFQLECGQKKDVGYCFLLFLCSEKEIEMEEPKSNLPEKEQGKLLIIDGDPEVK